METETTAASPHALKGATDSFEQKTETSSAFDALKSMSISGERSIPTLCMRLDAMTMHTIKSEEDRAAADVRPRTHAR
jgi:hypothetical protein